MLDGSKLKFLRYTNGVTQKQVAEWCGVTIRYIKMVEANDEKPSTETYNNFLNCIYGVGKPAPKKDKK